jgi:hypothetical protein
MERKIMFADRRYEGEGEVNVAVLSRVPAGATAKQPKLANTLILTRP